MAQSLELAAAALLPRKVGVVGFSLGGAFALTTAAHVPEARACVPLYGIPMPESADLTRIRARVLGHYARVDEYYSPERVDELETVLQRAGVAATIHRYDARHSFFNEEIEQVYSRDGARLAWVRTLAFLVEALR